MVNLNKNIPIGPYLLIDKNNAPVTHINGVPVTSCHHMFDGCTQLKEVRFEDIPLLKQISSTRCMFNKCSNLERVVLPFNPFPRLQECSFMFSRCRNLREIIAPMLMCKFDRFANDFAVNHELISTNKGICNGTVKLAPSMVPIGIACILLAINGVR